MTKTILAMASSPVDAARLRLDEEFRDMEIQLRLGGNRDNYIMNMTLAVRFSDMQRDLIRYNPYILHFSGHGAGDEGLCCTSNNGLTELISNETLATLVSSAQSLQCVLLNACLSASQASLLSGRVGYVIGMSNSISDDAARLFSSGFYLALGEGSDILEAFKTGANSIQHMLSEETDTPQLWHNGLVSSLPVKKK